MNAAPARCVLTIFGGGGDLARRKLYPALVHLRTRNLLADAFAVVAVVHHPTSDEQFRTQLSVDLDTFLGHQVEPKATAWLLERSYCVGGDLRDGCTYASLARRIEALGKERGASDACLFYPATPPSYFCQIVKLLEAAGLARPKAGWRRVVVEKPFGHDLASARTLDRQLKSVLDESQVFRIDHYLGKETVQNVLVWRFANGVFEPIWNRNYIDHVQITVAETIGVERRAGYYDTAGALRDMVPNHLCQLLALTTMEPPSAFDAGSMRNEMSAALGAVSVLSPDDVLSHAVRGQYGAGERGLAAYRQEPGVGAESATETFVAMKLMVDNWRWADVPFYLRTGKRLMRRGSEIVIRFKRAPAEIFRSLQENARTANELVLRIQPDEGISLLFHARVPGPLIALGEAHLSFEYARAFGVEPTTGYETLLHDAMIGDATLFQRSDMVEAGWRIVGPMLDVWGALPPRDFPNYAAGSWGPIDAQRLLARDGRQWRAPGPEGTGTVAVTTAPAGAGAPRISSTQFR